MERKADPKLQKTAADFKGKKVGSGGSLNLMPVSLTSPTDLSLNNNYVVKFVLKNKSTNEVIDETMSIKNLESTDPKVFEWSDQRYVAIQNSDEDVLLVMEVQTENVGIT